MKIPNKKLLFLSVLFLFSFAIAQTSSAIITRDEMMEIAENYKIHVWTPTEDNARHAITKINGCCTAWNNKGVCISWVDCRIDTPDRNYYSSAGWEGKGWEWEKENGEYVENIGIPYNWGGFSSLESFDKGYKGDENGNNKKYAGNKYCYGGRQAETVGVDCSGLVSRVWDQSVKYGTRSIPKTFRELGKDFELTDKKKYQSMGRGDAFNRSGHVMLCAENDPFAGTINNVQVYEASGHDWKVNDREYTFKQIGETGYYKPYSFYKQIDIDLVIDRSGSMGGNYGGGGSKMNDAKNASKMFVSMMGENDKIGVVSFDNESRIDYNLTKITKYSKDNPSVIKQGAIDAITGIFAGGGTSIGAGMQMGFDQLKTYGVDSSGNKDDVRAMILMSDGQDGDSTTTTETLNKIIAYNNKYKNNKIKVCTIGFGDEADQELLSDIATKTDCSYQYAANLLDFYFTYRSFQMEVAGEDMLKLSNKIRILEDEIIRRFVFIDSTVGTATIAIAWEGSDLDLTLIRPDGTTIDHNINDSDIEFAEGDTYEFYKINAPMHGEWEMVIEAKDVPPEGEDFILTVSGENAMIFEANLNKPKYVQGEEIVITAFAQDPVMDTDDPQYVADASFEVEATAPNQTTSTIQLYDDGAHNDGEANDGIYANTFNNTQESGSYVFNIKASGKTNRADDPFTREKSISTFVAENLPPVADANGPYSGYAGIKIIFDASGSTDPENQPLKYRWDFNNDNIFETDWLTNSITEYTYYNSYAGEVLLEASDGNLTDTAIAEINIKGAKELKEKTVENLEEAKTGDKKVDRKIDTVSKSIVKSLQDNLWQDEIHLDSKKGSRVFIYEIAALVKVKLYLRLSERLNSQKLQESVVTVFEQVSQDLVKADKIIAQVIFNEAKNTSVENKKRQKSYDKLIVKAEEKIEQAQKYEDNNNPIKAVRYYWQSWKYSQKAIREAGK